MASLFSVIGDIAGNILSGGLTGLAGVAIQRFADYKNKKLDLEKLAMQYKNNLDMKEADAKIMAEEWAGRDKVAATEGKWTAEAEDAKAFAASYRMEPQRYTEGMKAPTGWAGAAAFILMGLLDFIRGIIRPGLAIYLAVLTTLLYFDAHAQLETKLLSNDQAVTITTSIINTILYLMTTCVLWYYGVRNKSPAPGGAKEA